VKQETLAALDLGSNSFSPADRQGRRRSGLPSGQLARSRSPRRGFHTRPAHRSGHPDPGARGARPLRESDFALPSLSGARPSDECPARAKNAESFLAEAEANPRVPHRGDIRVARKLASSTSGWRTASLSPPSGAWVRRYRRRVDRADHRHRPGTRADGEHFHGLRELQPALLPGRAPGQVLLQAGGTCSPRTNSSTSSDAYRRVG